MQHEELGHQYFLGNPALLEEFEVLGERIQLSDDVIESLLARENAVPFAAAHMIGLDAFVRGVRQI